MKRNKPIPLEQIGSLFEEYLNWPLIAIKLHHATRLHFDLRFECNGVVYSFVLPMGVSRDPNVSREAIYGDDTHGINGLSWEGVFPEGMPGAGPMLAWEFGRYRDCTMVNDQLAPFDVAFEMGRIEFEVNGYRLKGKFILERHEGQEKVWDIRKLPDEHAVIGCSIAQTADTSVLSRKNLKQIVEESRPKKQRRQALSGQLSLPV